jgi:integrase
VGRKRKTSDDRDRYLAVRGGVYWYVRRVPKKQADLDERGWRIRQSLETHDLVTARASRDILEQADNEYWASLIVGDGVERARMALKAAQKRVEAMGLSYVSADTLASSASSDELLSRFMKLQQAGARPETTDAALGGIKQHEHKLSELLDFYIKEIAFDEIRDKSAGQFRIWRNVKKKSIDQLIAQSGDKKISDVTREDAQGIYRYWRDRVSPRGKEPTHSASSGNRVLGSLRKMFLDYHVYLGIRADDYKNPFAKLSFKENDERTRPSFSRAWIQDNFLNGDALAGLDREARAIFLALIDTGARPIELCNILPDHIHLNHDVPHIQITPVSARENHAARRQIKTVSSRRILPLVGISLEAFKAFPEGFPRYRDKNSSWSAYVNKYLKGRSLVPSDDHTVYCLRHSFEDRMKMARVSDEVRKRLMGHSIERSTYGEIGELPFRQEEMQKIVLPYDRAVLD